MGPMPTASLRVTCTWLTLITWGSLLSCLAIGFRHESARGQQPRRIQADQAAADEDQFSRRQVQFFEKKIRPLLVQHCHECHGRDDPSAGLRLHSRDSLLQGGESGPAVDLKHPEDSLLVEAIQYNGQLQMPPDGKLDEESISLLTEWVRQGAPWPAEKRRIGMTDDREPAPSSPQGIASARQRHWAFRPVRLPQLPQVVDQNWPQTEIDRFILARLEGHNLKPSPPASRGTLIRRAYFDLHGLPPSPADVEEFLADPRPTPQAFADLIDRLLETPEYGQRWARHWLDVARYSDTKGYVFQEDRNFPFAYTYRDYVVDAFNNDKAFDQFILEQLAADQLDLGQDRRPLAAMGYLTLGRRFLNNIQDIIDDRIDVTMRGLQGLTVGCARCHDHKFDPIPTADYYSLYGVFASSTEPKELPLIGKPQESPGYRNYRAELKRRQAAVEDYLRGEHQKMRKDVRERVGDYLLAVHQWQTGAKRQSLRDFCQSRQLIQRTFERWQRRLAKRNLHQDSLFGAWKQLTQLPSADFAAASAQLCRRLAQQQQINTHVAAGFAQPPQSLQEGAEIYNQLFSQVSHRWRQLVDQSSEKVPKGLPDAHLEALRQAIDGPRAPTLIRFDEVPGLLRRDQRNKYRALQKKVDRLRVTSPFAPGRAMVLVDGTLHQPLIFRRGNPQQPGEAVPRRFLAVLSEKNRQPFTQGSGRLELARAIASPDNPLTARVIVNRVWLWHFGEGLVRTPSDFGNQGEPPTHPELLDFLARRLMDQGWSLKKLHRQIMASRVYQQESNLRIDAHQADPENRLWWRTNRQRLDFEALRDSVLEVAGRLDRSLGGKPVDITKTPYPTRRTLYALIERQNLPGLFRTFDFASPDTSTPFRYVTTVPQQALFLLNSPFILQQAQAFVRRAEVLEQEDPAKRVQAMYRLAFGREPSQEEIRLAVAFVGSQPPASLAVWTYGYGSIDNKTGQVDRFAALPHFTGTCWQGGPKLPDPQLNWTSLHAAGGHPGNSPAQLAIRRWTAPADGVVTVEADLKHPAAQGNGIRGRIVLSQKGTLGKWEAHHSQVATNLKDVRVQAGQHLDFVVDHRGEIGWDAFEWSPVVILKTSTTEQPFDARAEFGGPDQSHQQSAKLRPWEQLAQVLLMSNEFTYVD